LPGYAFFGIRVRLGRIGGIAAAVAPLFRREPDSSPRRHWKETEPERGSMLRARSAALFVLLACVLALPAAASAKSPALAMLQKVNAFRKSHGVRPVHLSRSLEHSALAYSRYMMRSGYFGHSSRIHASHRFRSLGEIIELQRGPQPGVGVAFRAWVNSPPHRQIMLMSQFKFAGAGFVNGRFHGQRDTIWTMHFGSH
jgi:uncharacterized protein YkwD